MNNKTIYLSSLKSFDEITGEYKMQCVCGEVIEIHPSQLRQLRVKIPCTACYMKYDLQLSELDIGIAYYYLHEYAEAIRHYLCFQQEHKGDVEIANNVEYNVYDAFCRIYDRQTSPEDKQECESKFYQLYPKSKYDLRGRTKQRELQTGLRTSDEMEDYFKERVFTIHSICEEIIQLQTERKRGDTKH